ncbi:transmembrane protein, putative [Medicago truncatula]|uniref:Transmembrane protein, putative n=1 Tax=Medicago truncatula TaxID=3880 RepID=G7KD72_MEDTR|nr:transmembrane protein, putative [Medicago truncatula]
MTLASSTLQIRKHGYFGNLNIVICVGICTLSFYAINMDDVSLLTYSSFLFLANLHYIDVLFQFE